LVFSLSVLENRAPPLSVEAIAVRRVFSRVFRGHAGKALFCFFPAFRAPGKYQSIRVFPRLVPLSSPCEIPSSPPLPSSFRREFQGVQSSLSSLKETTLSSLSAPLLQKRTPSPPPFDGPSLLSAYFQETEIDKIRSCRCAKPIAGGDSPRGDFKRSQLFLPCDEPIFSYFLFFFGGERKSFFFVPQRTPCIVRNHHCNKIAASPPLPRQTLCSFRLGL